MAILDIHGNPIEEQVLSEQQTSRVASLHQEFATHPSRGLTPSRLAAILEEGEQGNLISQANLFDDMEEKDGHIFAEMSKRKRALLGLDWNIEPPRNATAAEEKIAEEIKEMLLDMPDLSDVIFDIADGIGKGFSCLEYEWERLGSTWLPKELLHRPQSWFMLPQKDRNELRLRNNTGQGEALQPFGWVTHVHKARSGYLGRAGLSRVLAWPYLFKNYSVRDLAEFLEIYGLPLRLGTYPAGASDKEKTTLMNAVINIGHAAAGIIPEGMAIDFKESAEGTEKPFEAMMNWCERTQSKAILGATLTSQTDGGSGAYALGNVHLEVMGDLVESDARQVEGTITRDIVYPLAALNTKGVDGLSRLPRFKFDTRKAEDLELYSKAIPSLVGVGMEIPVSHVRDRLRIPAPEKGEEILTLKQPTAALRNHSVAALRSHTGEDAGVADDYADQVETAAAKAMDGLIEPVRVLVMKAKNLEEIRDGLLDLYGKQDLGDFGTTLQRALAAAELAGRFEVSEGN